MFKSFVMALTVMILSILFSLSAIIFQVTNFCGFYLEPIFIVYFCILSIVSLISIIILMHNYNKTPTAKARKIINRIIRDMKKMSKEEFKKRDEKINVIQEGDENGH